MHLYVKYNFGGIAVIVFLGLFWWQGTVSADDAQHSLPQKSRELYHQKQKYYHIFCAALYSVKIKRNASGLKTHKKPGCKQ